MLATSHEKCKWEYPVIATPKLDGIRALKIDGQMVSRSFKPIRNEHIQRMCKGLPDGLDGELVCGSFNNSSSAIMSEDGEPDFTYHIFDYVMEHTDMNYEDRLVVMGNLALPDFCELVLGEEVNNEAELESTMGHYIDEGYEGVCFRPPQSMYECKRSKNLIKMKRWVDSEARVIGFEEQKHNNNKLEEDNFGYAKRSKAKEGMVGADKLGKIFVVDIYTGIKFSIGSGFDNSAREEIWARIDEYFGKIVKYKYQKEGSKDKPRFPVFLGFRHEEDL